jgi:hypothetical protein
MDNHVQPFCLLSSLLVLACCPTFYIASIQSLHSPPSPALRYRVMVDLEQPFDGKGMDDVYFELDNEFLEVGV